MAGISFRVDFLDLMAPTVPECWVRWVSIRSRASGCDSWWLIRLVAVLLMLAVRIASKRTEAADEDEAAEEELVERLSPSSGMDLYNFSFSSGLRR